MNTDVSNNPNQPIFLHIKINNILKMKFLLIQYNFMRNSLLITKAGQPTIGLTYTYLQIDMKDHRASLGIHVSLCRVLQAMLAL